MQNWHKLPAMSSIYTLNCWSHSDAGLSWVVITNHFLHYSHWVLHLCLLKGWSWNDDSTPCSKQDIWEETVTLYTFFTDAGYVMYFDTSSGKIDEVAVLESRILYPKRTQQCLQFFYKTTGSLSDKLIIWLKEDDGTGNVRKMRKIQTFQGNSGNMRVGSEIKIFSQSYQNILQSG